MLLFASPNLWANQHDVKDLYPSIYFEADNLLYENDGKILKPAVMQNYSTILHS